MNQFRGNSLKILLASVLLTGCSSTQRWADQWADLPRITSSRVQSVSGERSSNQIFGFHGYRFGLVGASIFIKLDSSPLPRGGDSKPIMKVHLASDINGNSFSGNILRTREGEYWLLGAMDRLTVRLWQHEGLLFFFDEGNFPPFFLKPENNFFDLDLTAYAEIPSGAATYHCVAVEAKMLAFKEFGRVKVDAKNKRISTEEIEYIQKKIANYLSSNSDLCSRSARF